FFHHPDELRKEVLEAGLVVEGVLAIEGAAIFLQDLDEQWSDPVRQERILQALRWLESEPAVLGATGHIVAIASKAH
ncbi:MAG: SAM-dependent methyltransferase, partial [Proteobacteria bacterium]|nr:SAM-dependent methyltransferase [Pseudomonadota bacterium]